MVGIDRGRVRHSFDSHAGDYDCHAMVQKRVVNRFMELFARLAVAPQRILDIGAGTGMLLDSLARVYPETMLVGLDLAYGMCQATRERLAGVSLQAPCSGDAESLPFADGSFDLVVSTSTLQWLEKLEQVFAETYRVLAPGGMFCLALFGETTLHELRSSYRQAWQTFGRGEENRTHNFFTIGQVAAALKQENFQADLLVSELESEYYPDVPALLRNLRRIGAGNASPDHPHSLAGRRLMLAMMENYASQFGSAAGIPATYQVIYCSGRKAVS